MSQWQTEAAKAWRKAVYPTTVEEPPFERSLAVGPGGFKTRRRSGENTTVLLRTLDKQLYPCEPQPRQVIRHRSFTRSLGALPDARTPDDASSVEWLVDPLHLEGTFRPRNAHDAASFQEYRSAVVSFGDCIVKPPRGC